MNNAHLHLIINHFPVLGSLFSLGLLMLAYLKRSGDIEFTAYSSLLLTGVLAMATFFTGEPAEQVVEHEPGVTESVIHPHEVAAKAAMIAAVSAGLLSGFALWTVMKQGKTVSGPVRMGVGAVALISTLSMANTARLGGEIRHTEIRDGAAIPAEHADKD